MSNNSSSSVDSLEKIKKKDNEAPKIPAQKLNPENLNVASGWNFVENKKERGKLFNRSHHTVDDEDFYSLEDD